MPDSKFKRCVKYLYESKSWFVRGGNILVHITTLGISLAGFITTATPRRVIVEKALLDNDRYIDNLRKFGQINEKTFIKDFNKDRALSEVGPSSSSMPRLDIFTDLRHQQLRMTMARNKNLRRNSLHVVTPTQPDVIDEVDKEAEVAIENNTR